MRCLRSSIGKCYHVSHGNDDAAVSVSSRVSLLVRSFDSDAHSLPCRFHNSRRVADSFDCSETVISVDDARADKLSLLFHD